jgi:WD40 repeat protein
MESTNLRNEADGPNASHDFDVFLSYSRKDSAFAGRLENALESYRFPKSLQSVKRSLNVFRDESDITASDDYHRTIEQHLKGSAKLLVICSPDARKSKYVEDEIRRFIESRGEQDIIPVLLRGKPNNETTDESEKAFPEVMCENRMPLAANFVGCDLHRGRLDKGVYRGSFYSVLAAIHGIDRRRLEQIDEKVRSRRRMLALSIASMIILVLSVSLVFAVISQRKAVAATKEAETAKDKALASAKSEEKAKDDALAAGKAEKAAKDEAIKAKDAAVASAKAEKKAKDEAVAAAAAEKTAKDKAVAAAKAEEVAKNEAIAQKQTAERLLYAANVNLARQSYTTGNLERSFQSLETHLPAKPTDEDMRGFEWYYLSGLYHRKLASFEAHDSEVRNMAFSLDGKLLVTTSFDKVNLWDAGSRKLLVSFGTDELGIDDVRHRVTYYEVKPVFSPDSRWLALVSQFGTFKLLDTASHKWVGKIEDAGDRTEVYSISGAFSYDGRMFAIGSDQTYELWDLATQKPIAKFEPDKKAAERAAPSSSGSAVAFSHNGKSTAYFQRSVIEVRDIATQKVLSRIDVPNGTAVQAMTFSADDQMVRLGSEKGVASFSLNDKRSESFKIPKGETGSILEPAHLVVAFSPDDLTYASAESEAVVYGGGVKLWSVASNELLATFGGLGGKGNVESLAFSADSKTLAVGAEKVIEFDDANVQRNSVVIQEGSETTFAGFSRDGQRFAVAEQTNVTMWDIASTKSAATAPFPIGKNDKLALSPDGKTLAITTKSSVLLWDVASHQITTTIDMPRREAEDSLIRPYGLAFSPDGRVLAIGLDGAYVQWWDISKRQLSGQHTPRSLKTVTSHLAFSPDGKFLAALVGEDEGISVGIWDTASRQNIGRIHYPEEMEMRVFALAFSADSKVLALGLGGQVAQLWDVSFLTQWKSEKPQTWNPADPAMRKFLLATLGGHSGWVTALAWSPDNKTLATATLNGEVKLWNRNSYQQLLELPGQVGGIMSLAFSPNNEILLAGGEKGLHLWHAPRSNDKASLRRAPFTLPNSLEGTANSPGNALLSLILTGRASHWFDLVSPALRR